MSTRRVEESKRKQQEELNCNTKKVKLSIVEIEREEISNNEIANEIQSMEANLDKNVAESGSEIISINHQLDHDCLVKIFSYIPALDRLEIRKVCKKWEEAVAMSWHSVKKIDAENLQIPINKREETLKELLNTCCKYLTHLTIDERYSWMADILKNNCNNIVYLNINLCHVYWYSICDAISSMSKLKYIKVTEVHDYQNMWEQLLAQLPIDISEIHLLVSEHNFPKNVPELNQFRNLLRLTLNSFRLTTSTIDSILLNKKSLVYLNLMDCLFPEQCPKIFGELVNLEHLNLGRVGNLNNDVITEIAHNCQKLKYLKYSASGIPVAHNIFRELKYLVHLEHLDIPEIDKLNQDDNLLSEVFDNCNKLKYLNVGRGKNFSTQNINREITKLKSLEYLDLYYAKNNSESLKNIADNCLELKKLIINFKYISNTGLLNLSNLKKLDDLKLRNCYNLTGNTLSKIVNCFKNLVILDLSCCYNVTEDSLIQVGKLDNLKQLYISDIKNIPIAMFDYFRKLEHVVCFKCPSVTDEGIIKLLDNCFNLQVLQVNECRVTANILVHAAKRQCAFKVLHIFVDRSVKDFYYSNLNGKHSSSLVIKI